MTPAALLILALWLTGVAAAADAVARRRRARCLRRLAAEWRMTYNAVDRLLLARRIAAYFPVHGAADLHVTDLIYGSDKGYYRYVFTTGFTIGTTGPKRRVVRVASFTEPRGRNPEAVAGPVVLAPVGGTLVEQYRRLAPPGAGAATAPAPDSTRPCGPVGTGRAGQDGGTVERHAGS